MSWVEDSYDEDAAADAVEVGEPDVGFDAMAMANEYNAADRATRAELWDLMDEDEQDALRSIGIPGPVKADPDPEWSPPAPGEPHYNSALHRATAMVSAGMRSLRQGQLDASQELAAEIEQLAAEADAHPPGRPERARALFRAEHLLQRAREAALEAIPFDEHSIKRKHMYGRDAQGNIVLEETDARGKVRRTVYTPDDLAEAEEERVEASWRGKRPSEIRPEDISREDWREFKKRYPERAEQMLRDESDAINAARHGNRITL